MTMIFLFCLHLFIYLFVCISCHYEVLVLLFKFLLYSKIMFWIVDCGNLYDCSKWLFGIIMPY